MNYLLDFDRLSNRYFVMRHGHSLANEQGLIVSHPENGCEDFGLSRTGRVQVEKSLRRQSGLNRATRIVSSDFRRARESAEIGFSALGCEVAPVLEPRLRERDFGEYELCPDTCYDDVWREDALNADSRRHDVESVNQVMARVTQVVRDLENDLRGTTILLVSHGDALQILQTAFAMRPGSAHRQLDHLHTAEIRQLILGSG